MNTSENNNLCIIPARGGSKRIPRKNIKIFLGKPIIAYSIEAALNSGLFKEVMVSTDDEEIAEMAKQYGAKVPFMRSESNANDFATTMDVLKEVVLNYKELNQNFGYICCLYPTAPFVTSQKLLQAHKILIDQNYDSVLPIIKYSFPVQRSFGMNDFSNKIHYQFEQFKNTRSQDLESFYHDAGQFYWMKKSVLDADTVVSDNTGAIVISELEGQDIDNETDWKLAELKYELLQSIT